MKLVEREVKDQILIIGGRKLEVVFVFIHLLIIVGITMFLRFMFSTKFTEEEQAFGELIEAAWQSINSELSDRNLKSQLLHAFGL